MTSKVEIFYTGGGITIAETDINQKQYAVVTTEAPEYLSVYRMENGEKNHLPDDMIESTPGENLPPNLKAIYTAMLEKLMASTKPKQ